jgi:oligopeptide transport system substrate-binding protein
MSYMQDIHAAVSLWEGLMRLDLKTTLPIPGAAAEPPRISKDRKQYVFTLRPDARWSNGDPVTAQDFIRGWRRAVWASRCPAWGR